MIYRKKTGRWPEDVSRETGLQSYYEVRYIKRNAKYAKHYAKAQQWWKEYKEQTGAQTAQMDAVKPVGNVVPYQRRQSGHH